MCAGALAHDCGRVCDQLDQDGTDDAFIFPTAPLSTTADTTFQVSLIFPATRFLDGGDDLMDLQHITGWGVTGTLGTLDFESARALSLDVERISFVEGPRSSQIDVQGAVTIIVHEPGVVPSTNDDLTPADPPRKFLSSKASVLPFGSET